VALVALITSIVAIAISGGTLLVEWDRRRGETRPSFTATHTRGQLNHFHVTLTLDGPDDLNSLEVRSGPSVAIPTINESERRERLTHGPLRVGDSWSFVMSDNIGAAISVEDFELTCKGKRFTSYSMRVRSTLIEDPYKALQAEPGE
jgi:hypothetical protein